MAHTNKTMVAVHIYDLDDCLSVIQIFQMNEWKRARTANDKHTQRENKIQNQIK